MGKEKSVVVISPYKGDGKTTLIETICGISLIWYPYAIATGFTCNKALVSYNDIDISIYEVPQITKDNSNIWHKIAELLQDADLILYVVDSSVKIVMSDIDDFFDIEINDTTLNDLVMSKRLIVFTKCDKEEEIYAYWNSLPKEVQEAQNGFLEGLEDDWVQCASLWLNMNIQSLDDIFEVSCKKNMGEMGKLRNRIIKHLE